VDADLLDALSNQRLAIPFPKLYNQSSTSCAQALQNIGSQFVDIYDLQDKHCKLKHPKSNYEQQQKSILYQGTSRFRA